MVKALDENVDREDAIISISDKKVKTSDIGKIITLDLTTRCRYPQEIPPHSH